VLIKYFKSLIVLNHPKYDPWLTSLSSKMTKRFGNLSAVNNLSFNVQEGEIPGMMVQRAGKTRSSILSPGYPPTEGKVHYRGKDVTHLSAANRCRLGIGKEHIQFPPFEKHDRLREPPCRSRVRCDLKGSRPRLSTEILISPAS